MKLYLTADRIGTPTGGGLVTYHEEHAMRSRWFDVQTISRKELLEPDHPPDFPEPWKWDKLAYHGFGSNVNLAHIYSGTFSECVQKLKDSGAKVCYTIAAHDKEVSRQEHHKMGLDFPYPHLVDPRLWKRYIRGYLLADVIVCPGTVPAETVRRYGPEFETKAIRVIPHGCTWPEEVAQLPANFTVGYMGSFGCDKGVRYLLEAWKKLAYMDGSQLVLAGKDSGGPIAKQMLARFGGGNVFLAGWQENVGNFYNSLSCYVQPSATEGFGCEVLEAMAYGRPVICSDGAGAVDMVAGGSVRACDVDSLCQAIDAAKKSWPLDQWGQNAREEAEHYTWPKVREKYIGLWEEMLT